MTNPIKQSSEAAGLVGPVAGGHQTGKGWSTEGKPLGLPSVIHHTFAPLGDRKQRMRALALSYSPWAYKRGSYIGKLRMALALKFQADAFLFSAGREGLLALLRSIKTSSNDEVIVQGYTCVVLPNAIHAAGMKTVYADIQKQNLNLELDSLKQHITTRTKAIICQHTFGIPGPVAELRALCDERKIYLIEDCAHIIADSNGPSEIGKLGDFVLLSFGRDKAISGVAGGAMLSRKPEVSKQLKEEEAKAVDLSWWTIARLLEYPQIYALGRSLYGFLSFGKAVLWKASKLKLLIPILTKNEKHGHASKTLHRIPNVCAALALDQLERLKAINDHRRTLTKFYLQACAEHGWPVLHGIRSDLPLQKFPMMMLHAQKIRSALKNKNIILEDGWTGCVVCPANVTMDETGYRSGADPIAEQVCEGILSLPTHPGMTLMEAKRLVVELEKTLR